MSDADRSWLIERVHLGERPAEELTPSERARLEELRADDAAILARHPPTTVAEEIRRRARRDEVVAAQGARGRRGLVWLAPVFAAAALVGVVVDFDSVTGTGALGTIETTRLKGQALVIHRKTPSGSESVAHGDRAAPGDRLQLGFRLDQPAHVVLLSVDGRGTVTVHVPEDANEDRAPRFEAGLSSTPFSYVLDDAPAFERFFLLTADAPFSVREVEAAAQGAGSPRWPGSVQSLELRLDKEAVR